MSFGFGVGDFLAVLEIVHRVRKKTGRAPKEYQGIAEEFVIQPVGEEYRTVWSDKQAE